MVCPASTLSYLKGQGPKVLELGCSTGYFSQVLPKEGCAATGIDGDPDAVTACKQERVDAHYDDLNAFSISEMVCAYGQPDYVFAMDVLEHIVRPGRLWEAPLTIQP